MKSIYTLVRHLKELGLIGSLTRVDETRIHSGMGCDRPLIFAELKRLGISWQEEPSSYIRINLAVQYPPASVEADIFVSGTFESAEGKMFRGNGRWAKIARTKLTSIELLTLAFGREGETRAFEVWNKKDNPTLNLRNAKADAVEYILKG